ncbi:hypothetical protein JXC34_03350 [Candidatus Woesearchaeota archaeon]|nr:hypothetical protein [Candidatus Woesearchaeota archaeon]
MQVSCTFNTLDVGETKVGRIILKSDGHTANSDLGFPPSTSNHERAQLSDELDRYNSRLDYFFDIKNLRLDTSTLSLLSNFSRRISEDYGGRTYIVGELNQRELLRVAGVDREISCYGSLDEALEAYIVS